MSDIVNYFDFDFSLVKVSHFYIYFVLAAFISLYLVFASNSRYKFELFFISFFLLTGNINKILTFKLPGIGFFEIQPIRFIYLMLAFSLLRQAYQRPDKKLIIWNKTIPWYYMALIAYVVLLTLSVIVNVFPDGLKTIADAIAFIIIIHGLASMADMPSYHIVGKSIIIGAVISTLVSIIQLSFDPYFLRIGDARRAFGPFLRSNGLFSTEYYNSYYLIIAIAWVLTKVRHPWYKTGLVLLFSIGVITTFQRMSWIILVLVLATYFIFIRKLALQKIVFVALTGLTLIVGLATFFYQDFMNSTVVKERLTDNVDGRKGYYTMVLENFGKKPILGFGDLNNEVYYVNMLQITNSRERADATRGGIHNGYLSNLFRYGLPATVFFVLFVVLSAIQHGRSTRHHPIFIIPFLASIIFMIGNLTNTFLFLSYISVLYSIHIGMGRGIYQIQNQSTASYRNKELPVITNGK